MSVGLAMKSALYPFHAWLPDAYGYSTLSSAAILSSLVSKGYIFLLIKIFYRVVGFEVLTGSKVANVLFVFGIIGMIMGSLNAMQEDQITRMIAYSSVAQIGYIYMGIGLATQEGMVASIYHVISHGATKSLLFVAASGLTAASAGETRYRNLAGSGYRNKLAGIAFTVGSLFMKMVISIYSPRYGGNEEEDASYAVQDGWNYGEVSHKEMRRNGGKVIFMKDQPVKAAALICFIVLNFILGLNSEPIIRMIQKGLAMFG